MYIELDLRPLGVSRHEARASSACAKNHYPPIQPTANCSGSEFGGTLWCNIWSTKSRLLSSFKITEYNLKLSTVEPRESELIEADICSDFVEFGLSGKFVAGFRTGVRGARLVPRESRGPQNVFHVPRSDNLKANLQHWVGDINFEPVA
ncbi:hypothetical protein AVEN_246042-1 [Araneus ventricosus]|uniref:Uncharacterized protein n=1 Tax=Araneus ventricosus TaxID=182803 RepID=A0A4Y2JSN7_ARAVE|nr:hypothetical protein AVEN_246042-1 [Araneus ventricosus]